MQRRLGSGRIRAMARDRYDFVIVGGGSAGSALGNRLSADPANRVLVLEAGRPDYLWDVFIHMPAALPFPIGSRFYDWKYESEPEPHMNGRRIYHARGKVLGGSSSINGMIFQRGNPLDYERWGADAGMDAWDYAHCLPYFKRMERCMAAGLEDEFRGHAGPLVLERGPARSPLFGAFFEAVQQAGYPLTDDVNGFRQEGFAPFDRNIRNGRRLSAARAYLHPVMSRPNLDVETRAFVTKILFEGDRAVGVEYTHDRGAVKRVMAGEVVLCGGAINSPQLLQLSGVGNAERARRARHRRRARPARRRRAPAGPPGGLHPVRVQAARLRRAVHEVAMPAVGRRCSGSCCGAGPAPRTTSRPAGSSASNDDVAYPNLMFHFLPIAVRYDGSAPASDHGYQVHIGPMYSDSRGSVKITSRRPRGASGAAVQLPVDRAGPARVGRGDPRGAEHPEPAGVRPVQRGRALARSERGDRRRDPRVGREGRRDRAASLVHVSHGDGRAVGGRSRFRCACTASRACASSTRR